MGRHNIYNILYHLKKRLLLISTKITTREVAYGTGQRYWLIVYPTNSIHGNPLYGHRNCQIMSPSQARVLVGPTLWYLKEVELPWIALRPRLRVSSFGGKMALTLQGTKKA
jgi:hypothetical protein